MTFFQCLRTLPSGPTSTVERITPMLFFPYMFFSPQAPYFSMTAWSGSESSGKGRAYLSTNFRCEAPSSGETPSTTVPVAWISPQRSRKPQASFVQPGVSSFG